MSDLRILGKNPVRWLYQSTCQYGLFKTLAIGWSVVVDMWFDVRYGTDTLRRIPFNQIVTGSENAIHSANYGATKAVPFIGLIRRLKLPKDGVFVDLGSGKGRVLMLAAKLGFRKVIGIEFSSELCDISRSNMKSFLQKCPSQSQIEIIESDVTTYTMRDDESVFFMFDPFNTPVIKKVLGNIAASIKRNPRTVWLIYCAPREQHVFKQSDVFTYSQHYIVTGTEFRVYSNYPIMEW